MYSWPRYWISGLWLSMTVSVSRLYQLIEVEVKMQHTMMMMWNHSNVDWEEIAKLNQCTRNQTEKTPAILCSLENQHKQTHDCHFSFMHTAVEISDAMQFQALVWCQCVIGTLFFSAKLNSTHGFLIFLLATNAWHPSVLFQSSPSMF